uniref:ATP-dependent zinc metalloprotease YME1L1 n=1 Tax=Leptobrachium leishanense TaxID=445787 RepID=A0A8C5Q1E6_9ANUR
MLSLSSTMHPQVTVPLSHLITAFHCPRNTVYLPSSGSIQKLNRDANSKPETYSSEPVVNLKDLGLSDLRKQQLDELFEKLLPGVCTSQKSVPSHWRKSYISAQSFFENKHGHSSVFRALRSSLLQRPQPSPLKRVYTQLQYWPVLIQSRGFKTKRTSPASTSSLLKDFMKQPVETVNLDNIVKMENIPKSQENSYKNGFAEGFLKAQALTQNANDTQRRRRVMMVILFCVLVYAVSKNPFLSVRFRTTGFDAAIDPVQMKNVTFDQVKGIDEAKQELQEVVEFLKNPKKFTALGGKLPKGLLLVGPPGTGKTLLARAVAGEADVPFFYATGSEFDEMFVGIGASRIRNLFKDAKNSAPCVIFIDELDSVGGKRVESPMHPYARQTINQLLAEMDGFKPNEGVIIIGATNFPEALDSALVRPGRFDMQVTVPRPDVKGRTEILKLYLGKIKHDVSIDAEVIARGTVGFSGADLENLVNQAALKAAIDGKEMVTLKELEFAKDKILMGPERRSAEIDDRNKKITAYHESGHAIIAYYTKDAMPINKATIMPRGPTMGHVSLLPESDRWSETRSQLLAQMDVSMGGRVAEEIIFGEENITTGASSDFDGATKIARLMVTKFGMSEKLGVMTYSDSTKLSPETQAAIEQEVRTMLKDSYERAKHLLKNHAKEHKSLAEALLMYETLDAKEIRMVLEGKKLNVR